MKNLILIFASLCLLTACEGSVGPQGPQGEQGPAGEGNNWIVFDYTVPQNDWDLISDLSANPQPDDIGSFYATEIWDENLTEHIMLNGIITVYRYDQSNSGAEYQISLPSTRIRTDGTDTWEEVYDFDFAPGSIMLYVTYDDYKTSRVPPATKFRVVAVW